MSDNQKQIYLKLYDQAEALHQKYDPCKGKSLNRKFSCVGKNTFPNGCCGKELLAPPCGWLEDKGCTIKCLACKMWICSDALKSMSSKDRDIWMREMGEINQQILDAGIPLRFRAGDSDENCRIFMKQQPNWFIEQPRFVSANGTPIEFNEYGHPILGDKYFP